MMKITVTKKVEVEVHTLHVLVNEPYWEAATVNDQEDTEGSLIPCRIGDNWAPVIKVDTGQILN